MEDLSLAHPAQEWAPDDGWPTRMAAAEAMIPLIGRLHRQHGVNITVHGRSLVGASVVGLIKAHRLARRVDGRELSMESSLELLQVLGRLPLSPAVIDLARLTGAGISGEDAVREVLTPLEYALAGADRPQSRRDVVLYGFGRIGRLLARILIERGEDPWGLRLRAVVVRPGGGQDLLKRASLLRRDSVHGRFAGTITVDEEHNQIQANGTTIQVIYSDDPSTIDYRAHGIQDAIVIDNTGRWRDTESLARHLASPGAGRVLLTAPGKGAVKNIVHGLNQDTLTGHDRIASAASCTTNAIAPVLKAVHEEYGIVRGHVETVHSFTNDQNLIDNFHTGDRRGRSAMLNMVLTETGAAKAVAKALPELDGKLTGSSIRVPTPDVSLAVLHLNLVRPVDKASINEYLRQLSMNSPWQDQIDYTDSPEVVSTDFIGTIKTGVVDARATIAAGDTVVLYVWYDNERGYCEQVLRVAHTLQGLDRPVLPAKAPANAGRLAEQRQPTDERRIVAAAAR
ncbi:glyceraldehyde-3-phosphate dehydrogenase [Kineococcus sp. SYSU DK003]|uniref:glyceraldehyde-3-phosphate dehydrogenase n=1 Tax=Kineococcus sp. SYSU DK003 TaxID=3383124 RepID=UPI003D7D368F